MTPNRRMLLLDRNRYVSLLIEREIAQAMPQTIVSKFSEPSAALEELATNQYQVAVIDLDTILHSCATGQDFHFDDLHHDLPIILMLSPNVTISADRPFPADEIIVKQVGFQKQLPELIAKVVERREQKLSKLLRTPVGGGGESLLKIITSTLSHEINNPLMTILGSTELMLDKRDRLDAELVEKLRMIHESAQRIQSRLSQLANLYQPNLRNSSTGYLITTQK